MAGREQHADGVVHQGHGAHPDATVVQCSLKEAHHILPDHAFHVEALGPVEQLTLGDGRLLHGEGESEPEHWDASGFRWVCCHGLRDSICEETE